MGDGTRVVISLLDLLVQYCLCEHATIVWVIARVWLLASFVSAVLSVNTPQIPFCMGGDSTRVVISHNCMGDSTTLCL